MRARLRGFARWLTDWRNLATIVAAVLVALLAAVVVDSIQGRRDAMRDLSKAVEELERRGVQVDTLTTELMQTRTSRDTVAEELRALRELLIDEDLIEPRPQQGAGSTTPPSSSTTPSSPAGRGGSSPRPAEDPAPAEQPSGDNPPEEQPPPPPEDEPNPPGPLPPQTCDLLPTICD